MATSKHYPAINKTPKYMDMMKDLGNKLKEFGLEKEYHCKKCENMKNEIGGNQ
jgi:hypothetical protein